MIKARLGPLIILGFDEENIKRLQDNQPIHFLGSELGLERLEFLIMYGKTLEDIKGDLKAIGIVE